MANPFIKKIIQDATFNEDLFGEKIIYNGVIIPAIVEIGESERQQANGFMRSPNTVVVFGTSFVTVKIEDVPSPKRKDKVEYEGKTYYVDGIELIDSVGGSVTVKLTSDERGYMSL